MLSSMAFTHTCKREEIQQWFQLGNATHCSFSSNGKFCSKVQKNFIELWDVSSVHVPMSTLTYPAPISNDVTYSCHSLTWSHDCNRLIGVFGARLYRKVAQRDIFVIIWDINSSQVISQFRIPFFVTSLHVLPGESGRFCVLGTGEVESCLLLDTQTGNLRELSVSGEESTSLPSINLTLLPFNASTVVRSGDSPSDKGREPDEIDLVWASRIEQSTSSGSHTCTTLKVHYTVGDEVTALLYVVLAGSLRKVNLSYDRTSQTWHSIVLSSVTLSEFSDVVSGIDVNSAGSKILLYSRNCSSVQLFTSTATNDLQLAGTLLRQGDIVRTVNGEQLTPILNQCVGGGFVTCGWENKKKATVVEESVVLGVQTAGSVIVANRLILCRIPNSSGSSSSYNSPFKSESVSYKSVLMPKSGLTEIFIQPAAAATTPLSVPLNGSLSMFNTNAVYGIDQSHRLHLLAWCAASDFPGPMYPIGYQLIQQCSSYMEVEDELDKVVTTTATTAVTDEHDDEEPALKKSKLTEDGVTVIPTVNHIDLGGLFDTTSSSSSSLHSSSVRRLLPFHVVEWFLPKEDTKNYYTKRRTSCLEPSTATATATAATTAASTTSNANTTAVLSAAAVALSVDPSSPATAAAGGVLDLLGDVYHSDGDHSDEENEELAGRIHSSNFLSEVIGIPHKIVTGDYFAKLKRERDMGQVTVTLCSDNAHIHKALATIKQEAIERAIQQEEMKEKARIRSKEKAEEKRILAEQKKLVEERLRRQKVLDVMRDREQIATVFAAAQAAHKAATKLDIVDSGTSVNVQPPIVSTTVNGDPVSVTVSTIAVVASTAATAAESVVAVESEVSSSVQDNDKVEAIETEAVVVVEEKDSELQVEVGVDNKVDEVTPVDENVMEVPPSSDVPDEVIVNETVRHSGEGVNKNVAGVLVRRFF